MKNLSIVCLAVAGIIWNVDLGARVYVEWAMLGLIMVLMFIMGNRLDTALRRWENQPHWRKVKPERPEILSLN
jgi:hypothetical protein